MNTHPEQTEDVEKMELSRLSVLPVDADTV